MNIIDKTSRYISVALGMAAIILLLLACLIKLHTIALSCAAQPAAAFGAQNGRYKILCPRQSG